MKKYYAIVFLLLLINCKKEKDYVFISKNYLKEFQTGRPQFFNLDTISFKEIIGKHGTKILFNRESFNIEKGDKVELQLIELYDFKEILYRQIQTVATDNELLETSGVLKITFTSNGKKLNLNKNEKVFVYPPKEKLKNNDIYLSETDSLGNIKWKITNQNYVSVKINRGGGIYITYTMPKDSIKSFNKREKENIEKREKDIEFRNSISETSFILQENNYNWINIDKLALINDKININIENTDREIISYNAYILYSNLESFMSFQRYPENLKFNNIPLSGKTQLILVGGKEHEIYYDKIELTKSMRNSGIKLDMKKISKENLKKLFDK